jgi:hypothetical protein
MAELMFQQGQCCDGDDPCIIRSATSEDWGDWTVDAGDAGDFSYSGTAATIEAASMRVLSPTEHPNASTPWPITITAKVQAGTGTKPRLFLNWASDDSSGIIVEFEVFADYTFVRCYEFDGSGETQIGNTAVTIGLRGTEQSWVTACYYDSKVTVGVYDDAATPAGYLLEWTLSPITQDGGPLWGVGRGTGGTTDAVFDSVSAGVRDSGTPCGTCYPVCPIVQQESFSLYTPETRDDEFSALGSYVLSDTGHEGTAYGSGTITHRALHREVPYVFYCGSTPVEVNETYTLTLGALDISATLTEDSGTYTLTVSVDGSPLDTIVWEYFPVGSLIIYGVRENADVRVYVYIFGEGGAVYLDTAAAAFAAGETVGFSSTADVDVAFYTNRHVDLDGDCDDVEAPQ